MINSQINCIEKKFIENYTTDIWCRNSGPGSTPNTTFEYRLFLEYVIKDLKIKTVLDYGCGDWQFSSLIDWNSLIDSYLIKN